MPGNVGYNYKREYSRYRYYFGRVYQFYQQPVTKVSLALLLTIFTTVFFAVFAIRPTLVTIAELLRKIESERQTLDQLKKKSAALATAQNNYVQAAPIIDRLAYTVPETLEVQSLIRLIEGLAAMNQLSLSNFSTQEFTFQPPPPAGSLTPQEFTFSANLQAPYLSLKPFIHDLFYIPRLIAVDSLNLMINDKGAKEVSVSLNSRTFVLPRLTINSGTP